MGECDVNLAITKEPCRWDPSRLGSRLGSRLASRLEGGANSTLANRISKRSSFFALEITTPVFHSSTFIHNCLFVRMTTGSSDP